MEEQPLQQQPSAATTRKRTNKRSGNGAANANTTTAKKRKTVVSEKAVAGEARLVAMDADPLSPLWSYTKLQRPLCAPGTAEALLKEVAEARTASEAANARYEELQHDTKMFCELYPQLATIMTADRQAPYPIQQLPPPPPDAKPFNPCRPPVDVGATMDAYVSQMREVRAMIGKVVTYGDVLDTVGYQLWQAAAEACDPPRWHGDRSYVAERLKLMRRSSPLFDEMYHTRREKDKQEARLYAARSKATVAAHLEAHARTLSIQAIPRQTVETLFSLVGERECGSSRRTRAAAARAAKKRGTSSTGDADGAEQPPQTTPPSSPSYDCIEATAAKKTEKRRSRAALRIVALDVPWGPSGARRCELESRRGLDPNTGKKRAVRFSRDSKRQYARDGDNDDDDDDRGDADSDAKAVIVLTLRGEGDGSVVGVIRRDSCAAFLWEPILTPTDTTATARTNAVNCDNRFMPSYDAALEALHRRCSGAANNDKDGVETTATTEVRDGVLAALKDMRDAFSGGPDSVTEYLGWLGKLWGECAVCGRPLSDEESRKNGIGPTCLSRLRGEDWWTKAAPPPPDTQSEQPKRSP